MKRGARAPLFGFYKFSNKKFWFFIGLHATTQQQQHNKQQPIV